MQTREERREYDRNYYSAHRESCDGRKSKHRAANREAYNEYQRKLYSANREASREAGRKSNHKARENATYLALLLSGIG